jgi:hypothetical protein
MARATITELPLPGSLLSPILATTPIRKRSGKSPAPSPSLLPSLLRHLRTSFYLLVFYILTLDLFNPHFTYCILVLANKFSSLNDIYLVDLSLSFFFFTPIK